MGSGSGKMWPEGVPEDILEWNEKHMKVAALYYFDLYDEDDSDSIDVTELDNLLKGVYDDCQVALEIQGCPMPETMEAPEAEDFLEENDMDENETLSSDELCPPLVELFQKVKATATLKAEFDAHAEKVFAELDPDGNGKISVADIKEAGGASMSAEDQFADEGEDEDEGEAPDEEYTEWLDEASGGVDEAFEDEDDEEEMTLEEFKKKLAELMAQLDMPKQPNGPAKLSKGGKAQKKKGKDKAKKNPPKKKHEHPKKKAKGTKDKKDKGDKGGKGKDKGSKDKGSKKKGKK